MPAAAKSFGFTITLLLKSLYLTITDVEIDGLTLISTSCLPSIPWACLVWTVTVFLCNFPVITEKFVFNASINPKDLGPFPEYTLWYYNEELLKMEFKNPKDNKTITIIRTDLKKWWLPK